MGRIYFIFYFIFIDDVIDEKRNQLLRKMVGAVVVGAVGEDKGQFVGLAVGADLRERHAGGADSGHGRPRSTIHRGDR